MYAFTHLKHTGLEVARCLRSTALALRGSDGYNHAVRRYGPGSPTARLLEKAGVGTTWSDSLAATEDAAQFLRAVAEREILGRLPNLRRVAPRIRHLAAQSGATANFVAEHARIPVSAMVLNSESLVPKKVAGLICATQETLESMSVESENGLQSDLLRAAAYATDIALLDPENTGTDATPASLTHDCVSIASSFDPATDFAALVDQFEGDWDSAAWLMHPKISAMLQLTNLQIFQNCTVTGGEILGRPVLTSRAIAAGSDGTSIYLVDGSGVAVAESAPEFVVSEQGLIQLDSSPDDPIPQDHTISLFQGGIVAMKIIRRIVWRRVRESAVLALTGADYEGAS